MADLTKVRIWANALIALHLDAHEWSFGFDNAKTRAGLCSFTTKRITVSRYLATTFDDDEVHQVLLHEVAHALAGHRAGHGPTWRSVAESIGCDGSRTHDGSVANELAPWIGVCPGGHPHYRYRKPARPMACGTCSKKYDPAYAIIWQHREVDTGRRRLASSGS
ncbi:SprT-like domain-containing protein [Agreia sp. COWG]|uniref:SprT-like domain-containing protein n=1 Tax=Agreia sp. COWG TaxID=2773266 RepID=UPI0019277B01|nr:SprT-like domain-containing protein [Agreia sp. COWG]CAD6004832.1 SprT-like domain-containing protein [Agreia sp. COWG]